MSNIMQDFHRKIVTSIKAGQSDKAYDELKKHLTTNVSDAEAWYLLSLVAPTQSEKIKALEAALQHHPDHAKAVQRLARIQISSRQSGRTRLLIGTILGLTLLVVLGVVIFLNRQFGDAAPIPTLAVLAPLETTAESGLAAVSTAASPTETTATPEPITQQVITTAPTNTAAINTQQVTTIVPTHIASATAQASPSFLQGTPLATVNVPTVAVSSSQQVPPTVVIMTIVPVIPTITTVSVRPTLVEATLNPPVTREAATQTSTVPTATFAPTAVLTPGGSVPLGQPLQIGTGEMRVLSCTVPANALITTLGGTIPPTPAGQQWVVVEVLIICTVNTNCNPQTREFSLHTNGDAYNPVPLSIASALGDGIVSSGQVWGHLAFLIPTSEQPLTLRLQRETTVFQFSLQA